MGGVVSSGPPRAAREGAGTMYENEYQGGPCFEVFAAQGRCAGSMCERWAVQLRSLIVAYSVVRAFRRLSEHFNRVYSCCPCRERTTGAVRRDRSI